MGQCGRSRVIRNGEGGEQESTEIIGKRVPSFDGIGAGKAKEAKAWHGP